MQDTRPERLAVGDDRVLFLAVDERTQGVPDDPSLSDSARCCRREGRNAGSRWRCRTRDRSAFESVETSGVTSGCARTGCNSVILKSSTGSPATVRIRRARNGPSPSLCPASPVASTRYWPGGRRADHEDSSPSVDVRVEWHDRMTFVVHTVQLQSGAHGEIAGA